MNYVVTIRGYVYSIDPVRNVDAYARATFSDLSSIRYEIDKTDSHKINFVVRRNQVLTDNNTITDITDGIVIGRDTNVTWSVEMRAQTFSDLKVAV